jgi:putative tryptophan/tyrosine transport system substrate-binding protein
LRELGYVEGQNLVIEWRTTQQGGWASAVAELVNLKLDVLVVPSTQPAMAAKELTRMPIVTCAASDVVDTGLVSSLTRPGGNITGLTVSGGDLSRKRVELLKELMPTVALVAVLADSTNATHTVFWKATEEAARALHIRVQRVEARTPEEFDSAFSSIAKLRPDALIVFPEPLSYTERKRIAAFAQKQRLPSVYALRGHIVDGGLVSYAPNYTDLFRRCANYVAKIFAGAKPADLPIEEPIAFELVINLKTAKTLGVTIPQSLLLRADEVIQ